MSTASTPVSPSPAVDADGWPVGVSRPPSDLPYSDGEPLESNWHRDASALLIELIRVLFLGRTDYFVGGDMFLYFSNREVFNRDFRGPDVYLVKDVDGSRARLYWATWEEDGRYPNLIIELLSPTTAEIDRTTKKDLYERTFRTPDYFLYDPGAQHLEGFRLGPDLRYVPLAPDEHGRLRSEELGAWLGTWQGKLPGHLLEQMWLRLYTNEGELVPVFAEREPQEVLKEKDRAEKEKDRAEKEKDRAEKEKDRADRIQAELARLQAFLAEKGLTPPAE
ncbi:MAG TPA: Uma2 family endonuclease [Gemmataceae bacterium]|nr:Uma2 family endonuclease [Gemmataceae bacterium]